MHLSVGHSPGGYRVERVERVEILEVQTFHPSVLSYRLYQC